LSSYCNRHLKEQKKRGVINELMQIYQIINIYKSKLEILRLNGYQINIII